MKEFIEVLKELVDYNQEDKKHYIASSVLTSNDMKIMCTNYFGDEYTSKTEKERKAIRTQIFKELM